MLADSKWIKDVIGKEVENRGKDKKEFVGSGPGLDNTLKLWTRSAPGLEGSAALYSRWMKPYPKTEVLAILIFFFSLLLDFELYAQLEHNRTLVHAQASSILSFIQGKDLIIANMMVFFFIKIGSMVQMIIIPIHVSCLVQVRI
jgi:hypothetical protein